jgi:hypothetical protein
MKLLQWIALFIACFALGWMLADAVRGCFQPEDWNQIGKIEAIEAQR